MKNKTLYLTLLLATSLIFLSCAGSRKGYGCPSVSVKKPAAEKSIV